MVPSRQNFGADNAPVLKIDLRLQIRHELARAQTCRGFHFEIGLTLLRFARGIVANRDTAPA